MIRMSLLTAAFLASAGMFAVNAEEAKTKKEEKPAAKKVGFRVYTILCRSQTRTLHGVYESPHEAIKIAAELRKKNTGQQVEVTTGSEGEKVPQGNPMLYQIFTRACEKSAWGKSGLVVGDLARAGELAKGYETKGLKVEIVADHAPKEVYHVYGGACSRSWRLLGAYPTLREAIEVADQFRSKDKYTCEVTTGTKGQHIRSGAVSFTVYAQSCKGGWTRIETSKDVKKVGEIIEARKKDDARNKSERRLEIVYHHESK